MMFEYSSIISENSFLLKELYRGNKILLLDICYPKFIKVIDRWMIDTHKVVQDY